MMRTSLIVFAFYWTTALHAADQNVVRAAIDRGVAFLKTTPPVVDPYFGIGPSALTGLALLEAGGEKNQSLILNILHEIREASVKEARTYQVSLAIIFLDRYGDPEDASLIQILGCRLLAGQYDGGWNYNTYDEVTVDEAERVSRLIGKGAVAEGRLCDEAARMIRRNQRATVAGANGDHSNTQFAIVGLWIARRHSVPAEATFRAVDSRFITNQSPVDHGWGYNLDTTVSSPSMTCAGLLALVIAKGSMEAKLTGDQGKMPPKPEDDDPFMRPPLRPGETVTGEEAKPQTRWTTARENAMKRGLAALGRLLQGAAINPNHQDSRGGLDDLYFAWSLERVGTAYGIETIGGVDWYEWGCRRILPSQQPDGHWKGNNSDIVSTCFAILFLSKANFVSDLSRKVSGTVKDPGGGELRGGGPSAINAAGTPTDVARGPAGTNPALNPIRTITEADKIAEGLVSADEKLFPARLQAVRNTRGGDYTVGLSIAITRLTGKKQYLARDALASRLTRMTTETLKRMLTDRSSEVRRAAVLAVVMKDEKSLMPDVVERIADIHDDVVRAARAALKQYSSKDFGPPVGATESDKETAVNQWRFWWASEGKNQ